MYAFFGSGTNGRVARYGNHRTCTHVRIATDPPCLSHRASKNLVSYPPMLAIRNHHFHFCRNQLGWNTLCSSKKCHPASGYPQGLRGMSEGCDWTQRKTATISDFWLVPWRRKPLICFQYSPNKRVLPSKFVAGCLCMDTWQKNAKNEFCLGEPTDFEFKTIVPSRWWRNFRSTARLKKQFLKLLGQTKRIE